MSPLTRQGFGTQLLKAVFSDVRLEYPVEGLKCEIDVHLASAARSPISEPSLSEMPVKAEISQNTLGETLLTDDRVG